MKGFTSRDARRVPINRFRCDMRSSAICSGFRVLQSDRKSVRLCRENRCCTISSWKRIRFHLPFPYHSANAESHWCKRAYDSPSHQTIARVSFCTAFRLNSIRKSRMASVKFGWLAFWICRLRKNHPKSLRSTLSEGTSIVKSKVLSASLIWCVWPQQILRGNRNRSHDWMWG